MDVRVICATHNNLRKMVEQGTFRADLYYRIAGISITIPPLRERRVDIIPMSKALVAKMRDANGDLARISQEALEALQQYDFPGNVRELKNILQKALSLSPNGLITPDLLQFDQIASVHINPLADRRSEPRSDTRKPTTNRSITEIEATHIESLLHQYDGHRARVAEVLKISERTLYRKLKQYNLTHVGRQRTKKA